MNWTLDPVAYIEERYLSDEWTGPDDVDLSEMLYGLLSYHVASTLVASYGDSSDPFWSSLSFGFTIQDQFRTTTSDTDYATQVASYLLTDYGYRLARLGSSFKLTARPFLDFWPLSPRP